MAQALAEASIVDAPGRLASPLERERLLRLSLIAIGAVSVLWRLFAILHWSWFQDDWSYLERTAERDFWSYVTQNYNGHAMPLQFAVIWIVTKLLPLQFAPAAAIALAVFGGGLLMWGRLLVELFGNRWRILPLFTMLAMAPIWVPVNLWWAASLQAFGMLFFSGWTLLHVARYARTGSRLSAVMAPIAYGLGILWWQKSLLTLIPACFLLVFLAVPRSTHRRRARWHRASVMTTTLGLVGLVGASLFLVITHVHVAGQPSFTLHRSVTDAIDYLRTASFDLLGPSLVGGPWAGIVNGQALVPLPPAWLEWASIQAAVVVFAWLALVRLRGWTVLTMVMSYALVAWGLVFFSDRFAVMGLLVARDARYSADVLPLLLLALGFAISSTRVEREQGVRAFRVTAPRIAHSWVPGVLVAVVVLNSCLYTSNLMISSALFSSPKPWVDALVADAESLNGVGVADSAAPPAVISSPFFQSDALVSRMLLPLRVSPRWNGFSSTPLMVSDTGHVVAAKVQPGVTSVEGPIPGCGYLVTSDAWTTVPMATNVFAWTWAVKIGYLSKAGGPMQVQGATSQSVAALTSGLGETTGVMVDRLDTIRLRMTTPGTGACVDRIEVGTIVPASTPGP